MQNKKYFLLMIVALFFYNTQPSVARLKEKFNENKRLFITAGIGVAALASYLIWYFVSYKNKPEQLLLQIQKKKLSNNTHNLVGYITKTDKFIEDYMEKQKIDKQLLKTWKRLTAIKSSLSSFEQELKGQSYKKSDVDVFNRFFVSHSKNIEKSGNEILNIMFKRTNYEFKLYINNIPGINDIIVHRYYFNDDEKSSYFKGSELFDTLKEKNTTNVDVFKSGEKEISKYGFYEYTSQLLTPKFET